MRGLLVAVALGAMLASGCGGGGDETAAVPSGTTSVAGERAPAPVVGGTTLDGESLSLDDFRGRPVLVNVWSSW